MARKAPRNEIFDFHLKLVIMGSDRRHSTISECVLGTRMACQSWPVLPLVKARPEQFLDTAVNIPQIKDLPILVETSAKPANATLGAPVSEPARWKNHAVRAGAATGAPVLLSYLVALLVLGSSFSLCAQPAPPPGRHWEVVPALTMISMPLTPANGSSNTLIGTGVRLALSVRTMSASPTA